ncbi:CD99 antigen-like protein 2 isoform X4 [Balaenoptera musculus]|uniref:CD99 antigen-like protein 2 n=1 Tax=Balaenoptera musculus TaxID=9771 RepID=A0A8B8WGB6_BALMU|nr:CD99 antigen-like protein 2 isoform X4 [Balaenoptera musculus]
MGGYIVISAGKRTSVFVFFEERIQQRDQDCKAGSGDVGFSLEDALEETSSVKQRWDHVTTTTRRPGATRAPAKPAGPPEEKEFDLADALDDRNDQDHGHRKPNAGGGGFSDKDLEDLLGGGEYKPDKGKGDGQYGSGEDSGSGMSAETGTIAGVASALAMALIGAVSSYISYQQKKFCFSIQQGLSADYVKGEHLEAVVCEEPQVKYSALQTQSVEPPPPEPPRI